MANHLDQQDEQNVSKAEGTTTWQLNALTEALGDLTLTVSDSLSIGRGNDNDVVLGSKSVSRNHALLSVLNNKLYLKDLDSSNGTFINDERVESNKSKSLNPNDTISFASFAFQVAAPAEESPVSAPVTESSVTEPIVDDVQESVEPSPKDIVVESTATKDSIVEDNVAQDTADTTTEKTASVTAAAISKSETAAKEASNEEKALSEKEFVVEEPTKIKESSKADAVEAESTTDETVIKETMIKDVMASTVDETTSPAAAVVEPILLKNTPTGAEDEQETMMSSDKSDKMLKAEPLEREPTIDEPTTDEPLMKDTAAHQEPVVKPEQDKTTTTTLQEEADPDVLRAKQAATAQFSGTANLGQGRDLGTEGNNAMDQAVDNPANAGQGQKKPSGSWFIWVFIVIIIIGIALWLFNMGGA